MVEAGDELAVVASTAGAARPRRTLHASRGGDPRRRVGGDRSPAIWRATGFPDPGPDARVYTDEDVEMIAHLPGRRGAARRGRRCCRSLRVMGSSMARIADATDRRVRGERRGSDDRGRPGWAQPGAGEHRGGRCSFDRRPERWTSIFRRHVELLQRPLDVGDQRTQQLAVGFADLVGSTALAQRLSIRGARADAGRVRRAGSDVVVAAAARGQAHRRRGDVRGRRSASRLRDRARTLADSLRRPPALPAGRGGLAFGAVLSRDGDYFGPVVNLAARVVKLAAPRDGPGVGRAPRRRRLRSAFDVDRRVRAQGIRRADRALPLDA